MGIQFRCNNRDIKYILDDIYFIYNKDDNKTLHPVTMDMLADCASAFISNIIECNFNYSDESFFNWIKTYKPYDLNTNFVDVRKLVEDIVERYIKENCPEIDEEYFISEHIEEFIEAVDSYLRNYAYRRSIEENSFTGHSLGEGGFKQKISKIHIKNNTNEEE